jgi:hypothetical protein
LYAEKRTNSTKKHRKRLHIAVLFCWNYDIIKLINAHLIKIDLGDGVMVMSVVAGVLVCAFVYVIRVSLVPPGDEEFRTY